MNKEHSALYPIPLPPLKSQFMPKMSVYFPPGGIV